MPAGIAGLAVAALLLGAALWMQDYTTSSFPIVALFLFPVPVACGLTVGLVSPRKAIAWAPLWACVFTLLVLAIVSEAIHGLAAGTSFQRLGLFAAGMILAAASGLAGQFAIKRRRAAHAIGIFVALCVVMGGVQWGIVSYQKRVFEDTVMPSVLLEIDRDYLSIPKDIQWTCVRGPVGSYTLSARLDGQPISVIVAADIPSVRGVEYECGESGAAIADDHAAREYLLELGFRERLVTSLSRQKGATGSWSASLAGTRLVLSDSGKVTVTPLLGVCK